MTPLDKKSSRSLPCPFDLLRACRLYIVEGLYACGSRALYGEAEQFPSGGAVSRARNADKKVNREKEAAAICRAFVWKTPLFQLNYISTLTQTDFGKKLRILNICNFGVNIGFLRIFSWWKLPAIYRKMCDETLETCRHEIFAQIKCIRLNTEY